MGEPASLCEPGVFLKSSPLWSFDHLIRGRERDLYDLYSNFGNAQKNGCFFWDSVPNHGCDDVGDAGVEGDLFDRPGNKRGAGVRDGLATAGAERGLATIFGIFLRFFIFSYFLTMMIDHCDEHLAHCDRVHWELPVAFSCHWHISEVALDS